MGKENEYIDFEAVLNSLNTGLLNCQSEVFVTNYQDQGSVHVIGAPRSGTTLLTQLMLSHLEVGYINNLTAAFYKSPVYGIRLSRQLLGEDYTSKLDSEYGRTKFIQEPHEFSYFWKLYLDYPDFLQRTYDKNHRIDWKALKKTLYQMTLAYERPIVYKSFQYGFHAQEAVEKMPKTLFVHIERDLYQNAFSILKLRRAQFNNEEEWASIKPVQFDLLKNEDKYKQVIGQVLFLNFEYKKQLALVPEKNKFFINYSDLCKDPAQVIKQLHEIISVHKPLLKREEPSTTLNENITKIPQNIIEEFSKAEIWVRANFPELKTYNV